ncbi:MAG: hypothetical protein A2Y77_03255 [Planctomycetes bacterium RBG_13_62_9]|nr:MAG: hypothetical protein A2Y77_03255 [Planctomycetes bacterium RBG_13_62_9]
MLLLLASTAGAAVVEFKRQTITVPSDQQWWVTSHLADVDGDGLTDLLVLLPAQNEMKVYRQRNSGFAATPDQTVALPDQTAWIAMRDVDAHEGRELVISTATGLVYLRQDEGTFESSPRTLVEARQVFTADRLRIAPTAPGGQDANAAIPVIFEDRAVLYEKDDHYAWHATRTVDLSPKETTWQVYEDYWMAGPAPVLSMELRKTVRARPPEGGTPKKDHEKKVTQELITKIVKDARWRQHVVRYQDVNGDGREDVVLWKIQGDNINPSTTILLLLRGPDGSLPARPTRVLRHSGLPIRVDRRMGVSPFWDLDGDGRCELILVALKTRITSWSGLVDLAVSGGVDWVFTVRSGRDGDYSGGPDFQMDVTSMTPRNASVSSLFTIDGDFNGDGREDILVERGAEQFDVYLSSPGGGFFQAGPALSFAAPIEARMIKTADLNGDGISDLFVQKATEAHITVCLSQSNQRKGTPK